MKVVITGGLGFIGRMLARSLVDRGELTGPSGRLEPIDSVVLLDAAGAALPPELKGEVQVAEGDISDAEFVRSAVDREDVSVFHLAAMVSAGCEEDFDRALGVNLDGTRAVLETCRSLGSRPRVVFASSIAGFGGEAAQAVVSDMTKMTPETTYGMTKVIGELLVNDYSRKGFIDGRSARLPTVVIRPGRPNAAASSWVSGLFREPLAGKECVVPVEPSTRVPLSGYRTVVENLIRLHDADETKLGKDRGYSLPALNPSAEEMIATVKLIGGPSVGPFRIEPNAAIAAIYQGWAQFSSFDRATAVGLVRDENLRQIIEAYVEDFGSTPSPGEPEDR
jgi:D-erythronate 2-dehydrogenase